VELVLKPALAFCTRRKEVQAVEEDLLLGRGSARLASVWDQQVDPSYGFDKGLQLNCRMQLIDHAQVEQISPSHVFRLRGEPRRRPGSTQQAGSRQHEYALCLTGQVEEEHERTTLLVQLLVEDHVKEQICLARAIGYGEGSRHGGLWVFADAHGAGRFFSCTMLRSGHE